MSLKVEDLRGESAPFVNDSHWSINSKKKDFKVFKLTRDLRR